MASSAVDRAGSQPGRELVRLDRLAQRRQCARGRPAALVGLVLGRAQRARACPTGTRPPRRRRGRARLSEFATAVSVAGSAVRARISTRWTRLLGLARTVTK